jgi:hypothetical protein
VWIDDDGRIVRMDVKQSMRVQGEVVTGKTHIELHDFGVEVDVQAPPADEVLEVPAIGSLGSAPSDGFTPALPKS